MRCRQHIINTVLIAHFIVIADANFDAGVGLSFGFDFNFKWYQILNYILKQTVHSILKFH